MMKGATPVKMIGIQMLVNKKIEAEGKKKTIKFFCKLEKKEGVFLLHLLKGTENYHGKICSICKKI